MGKPRFYFWAFSLLVLLSCDDHLSEVGFKNPNRDFDVLAKEFVIPTKVFLMDSIVTSTGNIANNSSGTFNTPSPARIMVGTAQDPVFGKTTAIAYAPFWNSTYPFVDGAAVYEGLDLTVVLDYYWYGAETASEQKIEVYELTDSLVTYLPHLSTQSTGYGNLLGETTHTVSPDDFDQNLIDNSDADATNDIADSLNFALDDDFGRALFTAAMDTLGDNDIDFVTFKKFRRKFKGLAFVSPNSDKIIGFDLENAKTRITLRYRVDTVHYEAVFSFFSPGQASGTAEYMAYTQLITDRSGTPLAGLTNKYEDYEPSDGNRYVQAGTGVAVKLDLTEVFNHFKGIENKALSAAELRIQSDQQRQAPPVFKLRALKPNNRERSSAATYYDAANDPFQTYDPDFLSKHAFVISTAQRPYLRCDVVSDDGTSTFGLGQISNTDGSIVYAGYLTTFLQQELSLQETDFLPYYALLPSAPSISRGLNGLHFPADKITLTIYYTTSKAAN